MWRGGLTALVGTLRIITNRKVTLGGVSASIIENDALSCKGEVCIRAQS